MDIESEEPVTRLLSEMTPDEALDAGRLLAKVWPRPGRGPKERAEQLRGMRGEGAEAAWLARSFLVREQESVVAHALVFPRTVQTTGGRLTTLALAMVATDPDLRGKGLGARVVRAAFDVIDSGVFPFCFFQTSHGVRPFYERLGARVVENRVVNSLSADDPEANPFWDDLVMRYPSGGGWPDGPIDLRGPGY